MRMTRTSNIRVKSKTYRFCKPNALLFKVAARGEGREIIKWNQSHSKRGIFFQVIIDKQRETNSGTSGSYGFEPPGVFGDKRTRGNQESQYLSSKKVRGTVSKPILNTGVWEHLDHITKMVQSSYTISGH